MWLNGRMMNERMMWKEAAVAYFKTVFKNISEGTEDYSRGSSKDTLSSS
jgi:hypothetical protein